MDNKRNVLSMDFANNPELKTLVSGWTVGEEYELRFRLQLNEMTPDGAQFGIKEVVSEEPEADEKTDITPDSDHVVMAVMSAGPSGQTEPVVAPS